MKNYNPSVQSEWRTTSSTAAADEAAMKVSMLRRFLAPVGRVAPWVGAGVAAWEVCNAFIQGGCFLYHRVDDDTQRLAGGSISYKDWSTTTTIVRDGNGSGNCRIVGAAGVHYPSCARLAEHDVLMTKINTAASDYCTFAPPSTAWWQVLNSIDQENGFCPSNPNVGVPFYRYTGIQDLTERTTITVQPDDPAVPNRSSAQAPVPFDPNWSSQLATEFSGSGDMPAATGHRIQDHIAHVIDPSGNPSDAYTATVPDCTGLSYNACVTVIQNAGFGVYHRNTLSFEEATPIPQAAADEVVGTNPSAGSTVNQTTNVRIDANPGDAAMPRLLPAPLTQPHPETGDEYAARVQAPPYNMSAPTHHVNTEGETNYDLGPDAVTSLQPAAGGRVHINDPVTVHQNSPDVPLAGGGPGGGGPCPTAPMGSIDTSPLNVPIGSVFPFGIFAWGYNFLAGWTSDGIAPTIALPFFGNTWTFDFAVINPAMEIIRPTLFIVSVVSLFFLFAAAAMGISNSPEER